MTEVDLITQESLEYFRDIQEEYKRRGEELLKKYDNERAAFLSEYQSLAKWHPHFENHDLEKAADPSLLHLLLADSLFIKDEAAPVNADHAQFVYKLIAPRICDVINGDENSNVEAVFTRLEVAFRIETNFDPLLVPSGWADAVLVDCHINELPEGDIVDPDDREKLHVYYVVGRRDGEFQMAIAYIGIGTGEAYGTGPRSRGSEGRFRFYRYDLKDKQIWEYIESSEYPETKLESSNDFPNGISIGVDDARLLLIRGRDDSDWLCLADPLMAENYRRIFPPSQSQPISCKWLSLKKIRKKLNKTPCIPTQEGADLEKALGMAERYHRYFYVAWQHPHQLISSEGLDLYYARLPKYRQDEYRIYKIKPEFLGPGAPDDGLPIPDVLFNKEQYATLCREAGTDAVKRLEAWLLRGVIKDLYAFGNHPELRLFSILLMMRIWLRSGAWFEAVERTFEKTLGSLDASLERLIAPTDNGAATARRGTAG